MAILLNGAAVTVVNDGAYNAFPGFCQIPSTGDLFCIYRAGTDHTSVDGAIKYQLSHDDGATWEAAVTIYTPESGDDGRDPGVIPLANGTLLVTFNKKIAGVSNTVVMIGTIGTPITWGAPITVAVSPSAAAQALQLANGDILQPVHYTGAGDSLTSTGVHISTDNGFTWGSRITVAESAGDTVAYSECNMVQMANGDVVAMVRNDTLKGYTRVVSSDDGATWSAPADVINISTALPGKPGLIRHPSDHLVMITRGNGAGGTNRCVFTCSRDAGATWQPFINYGTDINFDYAAGQVMANGMIGTVIAREDSSTDCFIVYQKFEYLPPTITESFNTANSDTLGPDLTWSENSGDADIVSNRMQSTTIGTILIRADSDLPSIHHFVQAIINASEEVSVASPGLVARRDSGATVLASYTGYVGRVRFQAVSSDVQLFSVVAGSATLIGSSAFTATAGTPVVLTIVARETTISLYVNMVQLVSVTNSAVSTGVRTGVHGEKTVGGFNTWDNFEAGPLGVATPAIDPNGGSHVGEVEVTLATETPGATIYYTTDGSTPDATDTEYTAPFTLTESATVKAIAIKSGFTDSAVAEAEFTVTASVGAGMGGLTSLTGLTGLTQALR